MQADGCAARRDPHQYASPIVIGHAVLDEIARHPCQFVVEHLRVHDVAAGTEHYAASRAGVTQLSVLPEAHAANGTGRVCNQVADLHIEKLLCAGLADSA